MKNAHEKAAQATDNIAKKKPLTRVEALRSLLNELQVQIAKLARGCPEDVTQIPEKLDEVADLLETLGDSGGAASGERSLYETTLAQLHKQRKHFLSCLGGAPKLAEMRATRQPPDERWWWFVDQALAAERQRARRRNLIILGVTVAALVLIIVLYRQFLAPDPAFQASIGYQTTAENLLMEGQYEEALIQTNLAIAAWPDSPDLFILQGVLYQLLDDPTQAEQSFATAREALADDVAFYTERARVYLMAGQAERALADAEAALALDPDSALGVLQKAQAYEALGKREKAIENYELAAEIADRTGNAQLQVIARVSLGQLLQSMPVTTPSTTP